MSKSSHRTTGPSRNGNCGQPPMIGGGKRGRSCAGRLEEAVKPNPVYTMAPTNLRRHLAPVIRCPRATDRNMGLLFTAIVNPAQPLARLRRWRSRRDPPPPGGSSVDRRGRHPGSCGPGVSSQHLLVNRDTPLGYLLAWCLKGSDLYRFSRPELPNFQLARAAGPRVDDADIR